MHLAAGNVHYLTKESLAVFRLALSQLFDACVSHRTPLMSHTPRRRTLSEQNNSEQQRGITPEDLVKHISLL